MSRAVLVLFDNDIRARAHHWIGVAPRGTRVEFKAPKRSLDQNSRMWLMLTEVSRQLVWHGQHYTPPEWKDFFMGAYKGERWMPAEYGGVVPIGRSTSDLSKEEHGELMTLIEAFCARHRVTLPWDEDGA
jgi:hypothetical protein